ncbi:hypothetical protein JXA47_16900 [Candidatus Sumerlaeota bacterium]|nr:hypothetical protein [Candidatus Sumerlaeota bacterium]
MRSSLTLLALITLALPALAVLPPEAQEAAERDAALALPQVQQAIGGRHPITVTREGDVLTIQAGDVAVQARIVYLPSDPMIDGPVNFRAEYIGATAVAQVQPVNLASPSRQTAREIVAVLQSEAVLEQLGDQPIHTIVRMDPQEYQVDTWATQVSARVIYEPRAGMPVGEPIPLRVEVGELPDLRNVPAVSVDCPISVGETVQGALIPGDNAALTADIRAGAAYLRDGYLFEAQGGQPLLIDLVCDFDGYLFLIAPGGVIVASNDDFTSVNTSRIRHTPFESGWHRVVVTSFSEGVSGNYTLSLMRDMALPAAAP